MYKIITPNGDFLTETPNFIRKHSNNCYVLVERNKAEGVSYHGNPYMFSDGTIVIELDAGFEVEALLTKLANCKSQLAQTDDALIELYEMIGG